jgi:hypothetical protein
MKVVPPTIAVEGETDITTGAAGAETAKVADD